VKPADAYQAIDHVDVLQVAPRHKTPLTDDVVLSVFHRSTGGGQSVLLTRQHATELRDWLNRWIAEGWDGVPRRCPATHAPGDRWLFDCDQPPGHPGPHEGLAAPWPTGQVRERRCWS
jgi:hypothetical protein